MWEVEFSVFDVEQDPLAGHHVIGVPYLHLQACSVFFVYTAYTGWPSTRMDKHMSRRISISET
jgi:hypothetical protein